MALSCSADTPSRTPPELGDDGPAAAQVHNPEAHHADKRDNRCNDLEYSFQVLEKLFDLTFQIHRGSSSPADPTCLYASDARIVERPVHLLQTTVDQKLSRNRLSFQAHISPC